MGKIGVSKGYIESFTPIGSIIDYSGLILPPGWLWCDGSLLLVADYPELYAAIGDTFGSTTPGVDFNIPDFRGRTSIGRDDMGGVAANRITSATMNPDGITLGATGGLEEVVLVGLLKHIHSIGYYTHQHSVSGLGYHYHAGSTGASNHAHYMTNNAYGGTTTICDKDGIGPNELDTNSDGLTAVDYVYASLGGNHAHYASFTTDAHNHSVAYAVAHLHTVNNAGISKAHNNLLPSILIQNIIKVN
jgi:microcystin-dependent protein